MIIPRIQFGLSNPSRLVSKALVFGCLLLAILAAAILWAPHSNATRQDPRPAVSRSPATNAKRRRPEFVPGEAFVKFKKNRAFEGSTQISVPNNDVSTQSSRKSVGQTQAAPQEEISVSLERFEGSDIVDGLRIARMAPDDTLKAVAALQARDDVLYAEPNYVIHGDVSPNDPRFLSNELYGLNSIAAPQAWNTTTGSRSVVVGVIDEGIDINHPDLQANIWTNPNPGSISGISGDLNGYDFRDNTGTIPAEPHATHVAGTIGAVGNNGVGVVGVNWQVSLMSLRFISAESNSGTDADALKAYNYAKQMRDLWNSDHTKGANIRALNASYGGGGYSQASADAINALGQSGILFVAAAGNDTGSDNDVHPHYPSNYSLPNVISVAATDQNDKPASFSNFGVRSVLLGAPGVGILSTLPTNNYGLLSGTSMATPHVTGAAALLCAADPNLSVSKLRALLAFNGDSLPDLQGKSLTGRRLNVFKSLQAMNENDTTPPGTVTNFGVASQNGRSVNLAWTASGDDGTSGQASLYDISFTDQSSGAVIPLTAVTPAPSGSPQNITVNIPYRHFSGTIQLRGFDNVGNQGALPLAATQVNIDPNSADPYTTTLNSAAPLSSGGTALGLTFDDRYKENYPLPFNFTFFGQAFSTVTISTNGNLYFSTPPKRTNGDADDVPGSTADLSLSKMVAGMWDDLDLRTSRRADADVYVVQPDASRIIFRWQGVQFGDGTSGDPISFEIELRSNGTVITRYGAGNTNLLPVVGISGGEPDPYVISALTSETSPKTLTNAQSAVFTPKITPTLRANPIDNPSAFVAQHYSDFLNRVPDASGLAFWTKGITDCGSDAACIAVKRIDTSAAFFLSIEFQDTGYLVERLYKSAYGDTTGTSTTGGPHNLQVPTVRLSEFLPDTVAIGQGVVVGQGNWQAALEQNKVSFTQVFVQRSRFTDKYPTSMSPTDFVNQLNLNIGNLMTTAEKNAAIAEFGALDTANTAARARALRDVAENSTFSQNGGAEFQRAFVLMQYFGYLQRDPNTGPNTDYGGYEFWLGKLNQFNGSYQNAEMVKAFISSIEYRQRFGP